ncbi:MULTISPECIES: PAS domain S-box protein [unclassified Variovorax]|uniref:two-component system sensor histidine kinase NtrB n=1 Tax=Variovorax sp. Sphag1AA TaxID=2587027 RepID=UPI00160D1F15|nr:two-component system sensor histidine kinase DctS [Variovorax sp. Sphag1AA]
MSAPTLPVARALRPAFARLRFLRSVWRRWFLWVLLAILVLALLVTVVWLAGRHEIEQTQSVLERDTADAVADLRSDLQRNAQTLRASLAGGANTEQWETRATALLREHREWLRLEWLDPLMHTLAAADTPYRRRIFDDQHRSESFPDVSLACVTARKLGGPAFSPSHYMSIAQGSGLEVMEMCLPIEGGGYLVAAYSLRDILIELVAPTLSRGQEVAFTEIDGTRLVAIGAQRRMGTRVFTAQQMIDLPGAPVMLRVDGWRAVPDLFPNVLTALVTGISIALVSVLVLLARDTRRRQRAEDDLADALAFRKAMEDSVITGLRARDLQGRITYVNPAFCEMVGFTADELMKSDREAPYWPTELAHEYQHRQAVRLAGAMPPREGFESVFMHKDGSRFPVLIFEAPLINAHGFQTGWMSAFIDISEQRRIEELSRASQERLQASARLATVGEMASLLSHELTQPLAAIASYATGSLNLLQAKGPSGDSDHDDVAMAVRRIAEQADRAGQVIRSVHDFVRRRDRTREAVAPQALVDAVLPLVRLQARKLGVDVEVVLDERLPMVYCDRTLVEQVLLNLARNGMQAMDVPELADRVLRIKVVRAGAIGRGAEANSAADARRWLEFSVTDFGAGIGDDVAARLFTPFFTTRSDGMGLGLSLCRTVVEQHGGVLIFEPQHPRGTVFRFTLPVK